MKAFFKHPRKIDGKMFKGTYKMPKKLESHWYFKALVKSGEVMILDDSEKSADSDSSDEKKE